MASHNNPHVNVLNMFKHDPRIFQIPPSYIRASKLIALLTPSTDLLKMKTLI